jgi:hypothetical protein
MAYFNLNLAVHWGLVIRTDGQPVQPGLNAWIEQTLKGTRFFQQRAIYHSFNWVDRVVWYLCRSFSSKLIPNFFQQ